MPTVNDVAERVLTVFRECPVWRDASDAGVVSLARSSRLKRYAKGEIIFDKEPQAKHVALVVSGSVRATHHATTGRPVTVKLLGPGCALGVLAVFADERYPICHEAAQPSAIALIPTSALTDLVRSEPHVMNSIARDFANQTVDALACVKTLSSDVPTRLAAHLLDQLGRHPSDCPDPQSVDLEMSRVELAATLGTVPETLSRTFRVFQQEGLIYARGRTVTLLNISGLAVRAQVGC
ncbi:MAG: Crp/Fnr family transcriptional regulator [Coriobacteriia bacterium]|nr:Crp/Fnr family transcriptional regulator [Coriobacteriia bacterium]